MLTPFSTPKPSKNGAKCVKKLVDSVFEAQTSSSSGLFVLLVLFVSSGRVVWVVPEGPAANLASPHGLPKSS